jgi:hypothetical protein
MNAKTFKAQQRRSKKRRFPKKLFAALAPVTPLRSEPLKMPDVIPGRVNENSIGLLAGFGFLFGKRKAAAIDASSPQ